MDKDENKGYGVIGESDNVKPRKKKSKSTIIALLLLLAAFLCCAFYVGFLFYENHSTQQSYGAVNEIAYGVPKDNTDKPVEEDKGAALGESPIDLESLQKINSDVYAWIRIPGTFVDYPIAQSVQDDNFYLHRSIEKKYLFAGMIYTQSCNSRDFNDPVTVVYGHNMRNGTMFKTLHKFEDPTFFKEHDVFYIYTIDRVLTYRIVSAYKYDSRHIMNAFDFSDPEVLKNYQNYVLDPVSTLRNVREGVTLDESSKLVVLSTCIGNDKSSRYLVNGVLINDVPIAR